MLRHPRSVILAMLAALAMACADTSPTQPTTPLPPAGVPVGLAVSVTPTIVPHLGGSVSLTATVQVQEGTQLARVPIQITLQLAGAIATNEYRTDASGRVQERFFLAQAAEFTVRTGDFERRFTVAQEPPPPVPEPPPYVPPPPVPAPTPQPTPTPQPSVSITVTATPQSALLVDGQAAVAFTAIATPANGAGPVLGFSWDWEFDGRTFVARDTTGTSGLVTHTYTTPGVKTVRVRATTSTGVTGETSIVVAVTSQ